MKRTKYIQQFEGVHSDEYYTKLKDVKKELDHYKEEFRGCSVLCPCDGPQSQFLEYFKELNNKGYGITMKTLEDYGADRFQEVDFSSCDFIITNPPFSQKEEFMTKCVNSGKKFIVVMPLLYASIISAIEYFKRDEMHCGYSHIYSFISPEGEKIDSPCFWCTNLPVEYIEEKKEPQYIPYEDPTYGPVTLVSKVKDIKRDTRELQAVPVTFLTKKQADSEEFEIIGKACPVINGKNYFARIIVRHKGTRSPWVFPEINTEKEN